LRKGATDEEIKQAYIQLVKKYDPESNPERFMIIQSAYEKLKDTKRRAKEDVFSYNYVKGEFIYQEEDKSEEPVSEITHRIKTLEDQLKDDPGNREIRRNLIKSRMQYSWQCVKKKLWIEAIHTWNAILDLDSTHLRARNNLIYAYIALGYSYALHGLLNEAIDLWEKALQMNPDNTDVIHNLAIACERNSLKDQSERYWAETIKRWKLKLDQDPNNEYLKNCIIEVHKHHGGVALDTVKDSRSALEKYREILKINPNDFDAQYHIAVTLMEDKKWDEAVEELSKLSRANPRNVEVMNLLGWGLLNSGQVDNAFNTWKRSLALEPKNYATRDNLVRAHLSLGKKLRESGLYTPALVHFKALLKYLPKSPEVHFEIATTYMLKGDPPSAYQEFQTVIDLDPKNKMARKALAELRTKR
jgi:tetratricopeptide (TPR) repeat protein